MNSSKAAIRYARALFEIALERGVADRVEQDLVALSSLLESSRELRAYLASPRVQPAAKKRSLGQLLGGAEPLLLDFVHLMLDKNRAAELGEVARLFRDLRLDAQGIVRARVESAVPLDDQLTGDLKAKLEEITGKHVVLETTLNADLIGGMCIYLGSRLIDGSLKRRLAALRDSLYATRLE